MMPFKGDFTSVSNGALLLSALAATLYLFVAEAAPSWRRTAVKAAPVLLLAVSSHAQGGPWLLTAALVACAAGDAALAQHDERSFLGGLAAFLLGHLLYVALFAGLWQPGMGLATAQPWRPAAGVVLLAFTAFMLWRLLPALTRELRPPVAGYVAAILAMGLAALRVPGIGVAAGAMLFVASDAILATRKFLLPEDSPYRTAAGLTVWVTYYAAQLLITLAVLL